MEHWEAKLKIWHTIFFTSDRFLGLSPGKKKKFTKILSKVGFFDGTKCFLICYFSCKGCVCVSVAGGMLRWESHCVCVQVWLVSYLCTQVV